MVTLIVLTALCMFVIAVGAVLHFYMPESPMPTVIIGIAITGLVPTIISMAKKHSEAEAKKKEAEERAMKEMETTSMLRAELKRREQK